MPFHRFTRAQLFDLVWTKPMREIGPDLGLSGVAVRKACFKHQIPTPPQGHWNRVKAGRPRSPRPRLALRRPGWPDEIEFGHEPWVWPRPLADLTSPLPPAPAFDESLDETRSRVARFIGKWVAIRTKLDLVHPAIRIVLDDEAKRAAKERSDSYVMSWERRRFSAPEDAVRLRTLSAVALSIAKAGGDVRLQSWEPLGLALFTPATSVEFRCDYAQVVERRAKAPTAKVLQVQMGPFDEKGSPRKAWKDEPDLRLAEIVGEIAIELLVAAEARYRETCLWQHQRRIEQRERDIEQAEKARLEAERQERERIEKIERERLERLLADAEALRRAQLIRGYVAEVERLHIVGAASVDDASFNRWRLWALEAADRVDPVQNGTFASGIDSER